ncbi:MAG: GntR family transcriptional regulator [Acidobacteria bacterium]|nr:GntR family transcriptional regulator [Acidobacteriota bacterium]
MSKTIWQPRLGRPAGAIYRAIADAIERDVTDGVLAGGSRLPTHRDLAKKLGVTTLTITRAYGEASRRGLIESTVGRGTFVRTNAARVSGSDERRGVDLSHNIIRGGEDIELTRSLANDLQRIIANADYQSPSSGSTRHRSAGAAWIARAGAEVSTDRVIVTPGAQPALLALVSTLLEPGGVLLSEPMTYPGFRSLATMLRARVETVTLDDEGIEPKALDRLCRSTGAKLLYCVPNFQNPTAATMSEQRRRDVAAVARKHGLVIIEDDVYGFLMPKSPTTLLSLLPEQTCYVASVSKSVSPALRIGFIAAPPAFLPRIESSLAASVTFASTAAAEIFTSIVESGEADRLVARKRQIIREHQRLARRIFGDALGGTHAASPHAWMQLDDSWSAQDLAHESATRGYPVAPAAVFAFDRRRAPNAVRLSLGVTTDTAELETALRTIAAIAADTRRSAMPMV